ncbi:MAG: S8 family serine peptidase [Flavobacteriaceae bacterium]|nr:S8 family serine peptidase [Flavobacteriaceae bacterium]MDG2349906.1 S8 family serine peptidase [Flavobacteriaceae bacterium]
MKKILIVLILFKVPSVLLAQEHAWIYFTDKENVTASINNPLTILTSRAIDRKTKHNISIDERDVPLNESYKSQIELSSGIDVKAKSKWFNAVHVIGSQSDINELLNFDFVASIDFADDSMNMISNQINHSNNKFEIEETFVNFDYGNTQNQIDMINVDDLHVLDYTGDGIIIAVLDSGFPNVNTMNAFERIRDAGRLFGGYDFINRTANIYDYTGNNHGTKVLSTMAGYVDNQFVGTAPDASYYVFRTEEAEQETPVEESYWVEAAERADSLGVDIINTSLGYKGYDNPNYSHSSSDLDGNSAFITRGANIAFEKGLLLVNSAGNSGASGVNAPADAAGVFSIGAVDENGIYASFSSVGSAIQPTQKPDVVARGKSTFVIGPNDLIIQNSGTSFSSPIMAGALACLMQALPDFTNAQIMQLVRESSNQFTLPDYLLGYGIPDFGASLVTALSNQNNNQDNIVVSSNPVKVFLDVRLPNNLETAQMYVVDVMGKMIIEKSVSQFNRINLQDLASGIYFLIIQTEDLNTTSFKILKE